MSTIALLGELRRIGVSVRLDGENLRLRPSPGKSLPPHLIERVKAAKAALVAYLASSPAAPIDTEAFEERAAIIQFDGGLPREIAEGLARLDTMAAPHGFAPIRWQSILSAAAKFSDVWGAKALHLGWTPPELWGLHPDAPAARIDTRGLAFMLGDATVIAMDERQAVLRPHRGGEQRYRRWLVNDGAQLAWETAAKTGDAA